MREAGPGGASVPGGVAAAGTALLRAVGRGLEAVRLRDGVLLWAVPAPAVPVGAIEGDFLSIEGDQLVRRRGASGEVALRSEPLGLPASVSPEGRHQQRETQEFDCEVEVAEGQAKLRWRAATTHVFGMKPAETETVGGVVAVDLGTGRVEARPAGAPAPPPPLPGELRRLLDAQEGFSNLNPPAVTATLAAAIRLETREGRRAAVLRRWEVPGGRDLGAIELAGRPRGTGVPVVTWSLDRAFAAVGWHRAASDGRPRGALDFYEVEGGRCVAAIADSVDIASFFGGEFAVFPGVVLVADDRFVAGRSHTRTLRAFDTAGSALWERPLWAPPEFPPVPGSGPPGRG